MNKITSTIIVVLLIALVATFIVSAVSIQSKTDQILNSYSLRREELVAKQQQLQDMIVTLNSTLQSEVEKQQVIATQLGLQINSTVSPPAPVVSPTPVVSTPTPAPVVVTQPQPAPTPQPTPRVTRAS